MNARDILPVLFTKQTAKAKSGSHNPSPSLMDEDLWRFSLTSLLRLYHLGHVLADFGLCHTTLDLNHIYSTGLKLSLLMEFYICLFVSFKF